MWVTGSKQLRGKHFSLLGEFKGIQVHMYLRKNVCISEATFFVYLLIQGKFSVLILNLKTCQEKLIVAMCKQGLLSS